MTTVWLEVAREACPPCGETERRELSSAVVERFAEHGMPMSMLDNQPAGSVRALLRAMLVVRIRDSDVRTSIDPILDDCEQHPTATVRVAT